MAGAERRVQLRNHRRHAAGEIDPDHLRIGVRRVRQRKRRWIGNIDDRDLLLGIGSAVGRVRLIVLPGNTFDTSRLKPAGGPVTAVPAVV